MERISKDIEEDYRETAKYEKKASVVIPVYNAERYLEEAVESVVRQTYRPMEIILIDNRSRDRSLDICRAYGKKYENVHVYEEKKPGCAHARNRGMEEASGEYIIFLDADDYLKEDYIIEKWISLLEDTGADIAIGNYERLWNGRLLPAGSHSSFSKMDRESEDFRFRGFFSTGTLSYVWGRAYRASFLKEKKLYFQNLDYAEDKLFNMECYIRQAKYAFTADAGYIYRRNEESISYQYRPDSSKCWLRIAHRIKAEVQKSGIKDYAGLVYYTVAFAAFFDAKMEYAEKKKSLKAVKAVLKRYGQDDLANVCFKDLVHGKKIKDIKVSLWKIFLRGFSFAMSMKLYTALALGIKILADLRIDERLSDTGIREE